MMTGLCNQRKISSRRLHGMTLVEILIAVGIGSIVLAIVAVLTIFSARSFAALSNYQALDQASSLATDLISKEMRQASSVKNFQNSGSTKWIVLDNTNAVPAYTTRYEWTAASKELTVKYSYEAAPRVLLKDCDRWDFVFYQRSPLAGPSFGFSTNMVNQAECKQVTMSWKCSRTVNSTALLNSESVQTAQIVLRNQRTP
jgi:type II secretory pathway pseudopilin PulG